MLHGADELVGRQLRASDGRAGTVGDFLFNERTWSVTWLVAELGSWLARRSALVPRSALLDVDPGSVDVRVALDLAALGELGRLSSDVGPAGGDGVGLSRCSWDGLWMDGLPASSVLGPFPEPTSTSPHTRSLRDVVGGAVLALGGPVGYVSDLLVDDRAWALRYLVLHVGSSLFGHDVLVPVDLIRDAQWEQQTFLVDVRSDVLEEELAYDPSRPVTPDLEGRLRERFGRHP